MIDCFRFVAFSNIMIFTDGGTRAEEQVASGGWLIYAYTTKKFKHLAYGGTFYSSCDGDPYDMESKAMLEAIKCVGCHWGRSKPSHNNFIANLHVVDVGDDD